MKKGLPEFSMGGRAVGKAHPPLIIAEMGINHEGNFERAKEIIYAASVAGAECFKCQSHVVEGEMVSREAMLGVVPKHANGDNVWDILVRCAFSEEEDRALKEYVESLGMIYLCTPFSREAVDRLVRMNVHTFKIGSGECNNGPLVDYIASFGKPIILSTGMNNLTSVGKTVGIIRKYNIPFALLNCTSMYPTPYDKVRLGGIKELEEMFPDAVVGQSDHSLGNYTAFAAAALGGSIIEKHFTSDKTLPGPDMIVSIDPPELTDLVRGVRAIFDARGGSKEILSEERDIIDFAYACVVSVRDIKKGEVFTKDNIWVKRPNTGEISVGQFESVLGEVATSDIPKNTQIRWSQIGV